MKTLIPILLILLSSLLPACSGGGGGGGDSAGATQTAVILSIAGNSGQAAAASAGGQTAEDLGINHIILTISGPSMETITKRLNVTPGSTSVQSDIFVPNGKNRLFSAEAFSLTEALPLRGEKLIPELTGRPVSLSDESFTQLPDGTFQKTVVIQLEGKIIENVCVDEDGDGYGASGDSSCPNGLEPDCNDGDAAVHPGADDSNCNGIDENCNGTADEGYVVDETTCGFGSCAAVGMLSCVNGNEINSCTPPTPTTEYTVSEVPYAKDAVSPDTPSLISGDDESVTYTLPWDFPFYGENHRSLQITTNGSIWVTNDDGDYGQGSQWGGLYDIFLPTANDPEEETNFIPVIVPWNEDLTSEYYGNGVTVEVKTNPDRVVINWETETNYNGDDDYYNDFEAVLYSDGTIRFNYNYFETNSCSDDGSGVSFGDGYNDTSLTDAYGSACTLGGRSFLFTPPCDFGVHVDQTIGTDAAGCGSPAQPCFSVSYGLIRTTGHEPVLVAQGDYGSLTTGEIFPLVLKEGTSLLCEGANHSTVIDLQGTGTDETGIDATALDTHIAGCRIGLNEGSESNIGGIMGGYGFVLDDTELDGGTSTDIDYGIELTGNGMIRSSSFTNIPSSAIQGNFSAGPQTILGNTITGNTTGVSLIATSPGSVIGNTIRDNRIGIEIVNAAWSPTIENNILSCNTGTDLYNGGTAFVYTYNNQWDNHPPTVLNGKSVFFANYPGVDINNATTGTVLTSGATIAPTPCTFTPDLYVDQNGSDIAGCGTAPGTSACFSIGFALQQQPGGIIHVAAGAPYGPSTTGEFFPYVLPQSTTIVCDGGTTIDVEHTATSAFDTSAPLTTVVGCNIIHSGTP